MTSPASYTTDESAPPGAVRLTLSAEIVGLVMAMFPGQDLSDSLHHIVHRYHRDLHGSGVHSSLLYREKIARLEELSAALSLTSLDIAHALAVRESRVLERVELAVNEAVLNKGKAG